jgi:hypothetical protein
VKWSVVALGVLALCLSGCGRPPSVKVLDYGIYTADVTTGGDWSKGIPVEINSVENLVAKEAVLRAPCRDKMIFGWRFRVNNNGLFLPIEVSYSITHPPITYPDGSVKTEEAVQTMKLQARESAEFQSLWFFIDSCPHEYVPGTWKFRLTIDGVVAEEEDFEVYKP